ncbi:hypothetical protein BIW12_03165 [Flavobacterium commune]|uniref:Glycosyltransferase RgtA/B/C/D-like domain-containing protein n=1 Tax=Flavobacterium commune TaxID=1306519 RepID=A0A1D9P7F5_9FLAO|nr:hypothetical protein BIW12_03165 [Flavobacterium commune]
MIRFIKNRLLDRIIKTEWWIVLIGFLSILPFLLISIYANPSADDIFYHNIGHLRGFVEAQVFWYHNWSGRYISTAILSIQSLVENPYYIYKSIPIFLLIVLLYSIYRISFLVLGSTNKRECLVFMFLFMVVYLIQIPTVAEGFYWLAGAITYQLSNILFIWLIYFLLKLIQTNVLKYFILTLFLIAIVVGTNETAMVFVDLLLLVTLIFHYNRDQKINYFLLSLFVVALVCSAIVYFSPGNVIRASSYPNKRKIIYALLKTVNGIATYLAIWMPFMVLSSLVYINYLNKKKIKFESQFLKTNPVGIVLVICCLLFMGFFTSYWSIGGAPQLRTLNTVYFVFLLGFMYSIFVLLAKFNDANRVLFSFSKEVKYFLVLLIFLQLGKKNNVKLAYKDLLSGTASHFDRELKNRYQLIQNNVEANCKVPKLNSRPITIFAHDITANPNEWKNQAYSIYFGKKTIVTD